MNVQKHLRRWLLYIVCLAPAVVMLGYYGLEYIPGQREYFMNSRFRSLANIGDQVRMKVERLLTALDYATQSDGRAAQYIAALVPELSYPRGECGDSDRPSVQLGVTEDILRVKSRRGCFAEASLSKIFSRFVADDLFDDVILAESGGRVIYQRSATSPRIASLGDLHKSGAGADADAVRYVRLDDSEFALLLQPVRISLTNVPEKILVVCGLVRSQRLAEEARHVPPMYLLVIFAPLLTVFLSGPFLKILLLTRTGRLAFHDMALLSACAVITVALLTLLLITWRQYWAGPGQPEADMQGFANSLNDQLVADLGRMRNTLEQLDKQLPGDIQRRPDPDRTDLLDSNLAAGLNSGAAPFDFVFWTNENGCQVAKWTTKLFNTQRVDQKSQEHFQNLIAKKFWWVNGRPFTVQTLVSPTTSQLIVVVGMASEHAVQTMGCRQTAASGHAAEPSRIIEAALVGLLPSVTSPVVPPGAGFAIFDPRGNVIFHSSPERNLHENLFDEIRSPETWRAAVAMRAARSGCAYYRGRKYQLHIQPVERMAGSNWNIAVFRELEPRQAMIGTLWTETLILFLAPLCLAAALLLLLSAALRGLRRQTWRQQVDVLLTWLWPDPARAPAFLRLAKELAALTAVSLLAVILGSAHAYRSAGWLLPFCYLSPALAVTLSFFRLRKSERASWDRPPIGERQPAYIVAVSLLLALLAVVPMLGLFSVCHAFENRLHLMYWQQELMNSLQARHARVEASINGSPALSGKGKERAVALFRSREELPGWGGKAYMRHFWQTEVSSETETRNVVKAGPAWWQTLLASVRPETQADAAGTGALARNREESGSCRWRMAQGPSRLILSCPSGLGRMELASSLPEIRVGFDPLWWIAVLAILAGAYAWNCRALCRLFLQDFDYNPLPLLTALPAPAAPQSDVLLLGLPLARKDEAVRQWLGYTPPRVNLYAARFSEGWLEETVARLRQELAASPGLAMQAAAGGTTVPAVPAVSRQPWVHISNLEAKLSEPPDRQAVAGLLEKLITMNVGGFRPRLIVTSNIDPIFHFDSVLSEERKKIYEHPLAEPELQRLSRLLHNFRKVQVPDPQEQPDWATRDAAGAAVYDECRHHLALLAVGAEVASAPLPPRREALLARIAERTVALYKLFWACCTRSEKLLLVQLAQTGLVNPLSLDTLQVLIRKGLILPGSRPRIMNETFLRFLATVEPPAAVRQWETEAGESAWLVIRNVVLVLIAVGVAVVAMTQREAMQTVTAVLTGVATVMAGLFRLAGYFGGRREPPVEST